MSAASSLKFPEHPKFAQNSSQTKVDTSIQNPISDAISKAPQNSTIVIPSGNYIDNLEIKKPIRLIGEGTVTVQSASHRDTITIDAPDVFLESLIISASNFQASSAINILGGSVTIDRCQLISEMVPPILTHDSCTIYLSQSSLSSKGSPGLRLSGTSQVALDSTTISGGQTCGAIIAGNSILSVKSSNFSGFGDSTFVCLQQSSLLLSECIFSQNASHNVEVNSENSVVSIQSSTFSAANQACLCVTGAAKVYISSSTFSDSNSFISCGGKAEIELKECKFINSTGPTMICASEESKISAAKASFDGTCDVALALKDRSSLSVTGSSISNTTNTGISAHNSATISISDSSLTKIGSCGIEATDMSSLTIQSVILQAIGGIGLIGQGKVTAQIVQSTFSQCGITGCHLAGNSGEVSFKGCSFSECSTNGFNLKSTNVSFEDCQFVANAYGGIEIKSAESDPNFKSCTFAGNQVVGLNCADGAHPTIKDSLFSKNASSGCSIQQSSPIFENCKFVENSQLGMCAFNCSKVKVVSCLFQANQSFGAQIEQRGTEVSFSHCQFTQHAVSGAVILNDCCIASFSDSSFLNNQGVQVEIRNRAVAKMSSCDVGGSQVGIGINVNDGQFEVDSSKIHSQSQAGIVVGKGGTATMRDCEVFSNGIAGVYLMDGSSGQFEKNYVHDNGSCGFQVVGGSPTIVQNRIENHGSFGIHISDNASPVTTGNSFNNNGQANVNRE